MKIRRSAVTSITAIAALLMFVFAVARVLNASPHGAQEAFNKALAIGLGLSPLAFLAPPRRWLQKNLRTVLLIWWIVPIGTGVVVTPYISDIGPNSHFLLPLLVWVAAFWAMFAPVAVLGLRASLTKSRP